jgi:hypothetical protein
MHGFMNVKKIHIDNRSGHDVKTWPPLVLSDHQHEDGNILMQSEQAYSNITKITAPTYANYVH